MTRALDGHHYFPLSKREREEREESERERACDS